MKKMTKVVWRVAQWTIAGLLGIAALGAFMDNFGVGLCWLISALFICPLSRIALIRMFAKKKQVSVKNNCLKKNKGSVNSVLCGVVAVVFLIIGSENFNETDVSNLDYVVGTTVEDGSDLKEEIYETTDIPKETVVDNHSVDISVESIEIDKILERYDEETTKEAELDEIPVDSTFSVKFIDVGQADAALVECDGHYMLIDGGNKGDSSLIYTVLKNNNVQYLDIVVGTHAHEDHIGGVPGAFNYTSANLTLCPVNSYDSDAFEDFANYANQKGNGITIPTVGDTYPLGRAEVKILGINAGSETNNSSIVLSIQYGVTTFLFTGDAEREAEQMILDSGVDLSATVLKVGHHGSDTSTTYPFLREIMPAYAVISVGEDNSYGHPTDDTLSRLRDAEVKVFRTDLHGDIMFTSDGNVVSVSTERTATEEEIMTPGGSGVLRPASPVTSETEQEDEIQANGTDYIVNINPSSKKFHYPSCSSVKKMKESNKMFFRGTRDELISQGYNPCGNCHP